MGGQFRRRHTSSGSRHFLSKRPSTLVATFLAVCCTGLLFLPEVGSASTPLKKLTPLQKGLAFYVGKNVTFIIPSAVGGSVDQLGRDIGAAMGQYLHATFNFENIPTGNLIPGQDTLAASNPDGLTIGEGNVPADILDSLTNAFAGVNFNIEREAYIGTAPPAPNVLIASTKSSITDFKSLLALPNQGFVGTCQGITDINERTVDAIWGLHFKIICGYATTALVVQGFDRGDGVLMVNGLSTVGPLIQGGLARPILISGKVQAGITYGSLVASTPTFAQAAKLYKPGSKDGQQLLSSLLSMENVSGSLIMGPSKMPPNDVLAMRAAFVWAYKQPFFQQQLLSQGNPTKGALDGPAAKNQVLTVEKYVKLLQPALLSS